MGNNISIIIPTLNEEEYFPRLLDSLRSCIDFYDEIIIVDGGSKDKTLEIASKFPKAKTFVYKEGHEYGARNFGSLKAKGKYLLFLDADVIVQPSCFDLIMRELKENPDLACLCLTENPIEGKLLVRIEWGLYNLLRLLLSKLPGKLKRFLSSGDFILIRKDVFERIGRFKVEINGDGLLGKTLLQKGFKCKLLDGHRHLQVSCRRSLYCGFQEYNKHYLYTLENYLPKINMKNIKRISWKKAISIHKLP